MAEKSPNPPVYKEEKIGTIIEIYVSENHRNKRIGERLLAEIEKWFINKGTNRVDA